MELNTTTNFLLTEFFRILETAGRDWHRVRWAIRGLESELRSSCHGTPWAREEEDYIVWRIGEALTMARERAVAIEEFEWAHEISVRLEELGFTEKDFITQWKEIGM